MGEISGIGTSDLNNVDGFFTTQGGGGTVTPTPQTASIASTQYSDQTLTISNTGSYTQLSVFCEIKSGSTLVVPNSSMSYDRSNGALTWVDTGTAGTRTFFLQGQDFGFASSSQITGNYNRGDNARKYWRYSLHGTGDHTYTRNLRYYTELSQAGTSYPPNMTSATAPSPYEASASYQHSATYAGWKAFDSNAGTGWWNLGTHTNQYNDYLTLYVGTTPITVKSAAVNINPSFDGGSDLTISIAGANNEAFTQDVLILVSSQSKTTSTAELSITI